MSAAGDEVLRPILLRTSTPAPSEKVLLYLEKMSRDGPLSPPSAPPSELGDEFGFAQSLPPPKSSRSVRSAKSARSGAGSVKGSRAGVPRRTTEDDLNGSKMSWNGLAEGPEHDDDLDSNVQEQATSEAGHREPGPEDEPHGFYPSYGSSWGNMGPLPQSRHESYQVPPPNQPGAAEVPLPMSVASPRTGTMTMNMDQLASGRSRSQAASRASHKSRSVAQEDDRDTITGNEPPRAPSKAPSASGKSHVSSRSRHKTLDGIDEGADEGRSTVSKATTRKSHKAPSAISAARSLSPSDSQSIVAMKRHVAQMQAAQPTRSVSQASADPQREHAASPPRSPAVRSQQAPLSPPNPSRAFSPHRHAATNEDLFHAAMLNTAASPAPNRAPSVRSAARTASRAPTITVDKAPTEPAGDVTPTPSRPQSPGDAMTVAEEKLINDFLARTPAARTSYAPSALEPEIVNTHYHDMELCVLLHALDDPGQHELAKKALRKGVRQRVKRLGMKYDNESIKQLRKSYHDHDPSVHLQAQMTGATSVAGANPQEPPDWAKEIMQGLAVLQGRVEGLGPKIDQIRTSQNGSYVADGEHGYTPSERERYGQSPMTQNIPIQGQMTGTIAESVFQPPETDYLGDSGQTIGQEASTHGGDLNEEDEFVDDETQHRGLSTRGDDETHLAPPSEYLGREESPGQQFLEEELYKLRVRPGGSQSAYTHKTWEVAREDGEYEDDENDEHAAITESGLPEIPGSQNYTEMGPTSPALPPLPVEQAESGAGQMLYGQYADEQLPPPWQRIHQRLLSWAIVWPMSELDNALNSTTRGNQVDEVALSIWSTQTYKRYVRSKMTDSPQGRVDRLFVPPNMADAISNAVYNGRHGDACAMLRDLWSPFGLEGMPRLLIVLAKHRSDENHWVVHRFSLPEGTLTTYDTYPERCLPDGRPLGWWFAIRIAWPNAIYPSPDHLMQKMVRLHRPMQLGIDNSVAAAGIWRNLLMGSRAERSLDLERLRDLINTEVKNLRQRKQMGKLSIGSPQQRQNWFD